MSKSWSYIPTVLISYISQFCDTHSAVSLLTTCTPWNKETIWKSAFMRRYGNRLSFYSILTVPWKGHYKKLSRAYQRSHSIFNYKDESSYELKDERPLYITPGNSSCGRLLLTSSESSLNVYGSHSNPYHMVGPQEPIPLYQIEKKPIYHVSDVQLNSMRELLYITYGSTHLTPFLSIMKFTSDGINPISLTRLEDLLSSSICAETGSILIQTGPQNLYHNLYDCESGKIIRKWNWSDSPVFKLEQDFCVTGHEDNIIRVNDLRSNDVIEYKGLTDEIFRMSTSSQYIAGTSYGRIDEYGVWDRRISSRPLIYNYCVDPGDINTITVNDDILYIGGDLLYNKASCRIKGYDLLTLKECFCVPSGLRYVDTILADPISLTIYDRKKTIVIDFTQ